MSWLGFLFPKPSLARFATDLIASAARAGTPGWRYSPEAQELHAPNGNGRMALTNVFLEYTNAKSSARSELIRKYVSIMISIETEIPKLWSMAQKSIYPVLRSRRDTVALQIQSRGETKPFAPRVELSWQGDMVIRIAYDSGPATSPIADEQLEVWGVTAEQAFERALQNLRSLQKPRWRSVAPGVLQLDSDVSYEESFLLRDDVLASCKVRGNPVFMPINRGVLLATGTEELEGVKTLLAQARHSLENNPWPLSPVIVTRGENGLEQYPVSTSLLRSFQSLQAIDTYIAYRDQQDALQAYCEKIGIDAFVASMDLTTAKGDPALLLTWATWTQGVATWLPKVDLLAFNRNVGAEKFDTLFVPWASAYELCRAYMRPLDENPVRFSVEAFPDEHDWQRLRERAVSPG